MKRLRNDKAAVCDGRRSLWRPNNSINRRIVAVDVVIARPKEMFKLALHPPGTIGTGWRFNYGHAHSSDHLVKLLMEHHFRFANYNEY